MRAWLAVVCMWLAALTGLEAAARPCHMAAQAATLTAEAAAPVVLACHEVAALESAPATPEVPADLGTDCCCAALLTAHAVPEAPAALSLPPPPARLPAALPLSPGRHARPELPPPRTLA